MDTKQKDTQAWLGELEQYARDNQLPMRILDSIEDCKNKISVKSPDWQEINLRVEDMLNSIEQKTAPTVVLQDNNENQISVQAIEDQIKKMAQRCRTENKASVGNITERKNLIVKKVYEDLKEITHTKAHMKELKDQNAYLHFFDKQRVEYEREAYSLIRELLHDVSGNYNYMVDRLRSMFQSIDGYKFGIGNEKFYNEFEVQREGLNNRLQNEVTSREVGGNVITDFAQKTEKKVKEIVSKFVRKRKILAWIPVIVLLFLLTTSFVAKQINHQNSTKEIQEQSSASELVLQVSDLVKEIASQDASSAGLVTSIFMPIIAIVIIVIIILYFVYICILKLWFNRRIRILCGEYLQVELEAFRRSDSIMPILNEVVDLSVMEYEQEYVTFLHQILLGSEFDTVRNEQGKMQQFTSLKESWNKIKYE